MSVRPELARPLRNRVTPTGEIVAHSARGMLMGNRGCLHDDRGNVVRARRNTAWISCVLDWKGIDRPLMLPGSYTELFFLDEATALAAGHRPCNDCRANALVMFKRAWARAHGLPGPPRVAEMDATLRKWSPRPVEAWDALPDGAIISEAGQPLLRWKGAWRPWSFEGYGDAVEPDATWAPTSLTPAPIVEVLRAGYRPVMHPSLGQGRA